MPEYETLADTVLYGLPADVLADGEMALYAQLTEAGTSIVALTAYLDSAQTGGTTMARAVAYDAGGALLGYGEEVEIVNSTPEWVTLTLLDNNPGGIAVSGTVRMGLMGLNGLRVYGSEDGGGLRATGSFATPPDTLPATTADLTPAFIAPYIQPWVPPNVDDLHLARLAYPSAQAALGSVAADPRTKQTTRASWHGTYLDPEPQGASFAIVQQDGPLADLVGRRIKVTEAATGKFTYAFVHRSADLDLDDGEQISLTRRLFRALAPLASDTLLVTVEELGPAL